MIPPPTPACLRQARMLLRSWNKRAKPDVAFVTAASGVFHDGRREAQVVG